MLNFYCFIAFTFGILNNNFIFAKFNFGINELLLNHPNLYQLTENILFLDINLDSSINHTFENKFEPTFEPTEEPTEEPTFEPTDEPTEEPTDEPTLEPTDEPTIIKSLTPTLITINKPTVFPTFIIGESSYKVLHFYVDIELINYKHSKLKDDDKEILLSSFEIITEVNKEYLNIKNSYLRLRKLFVINLSQQFYTLHESIFFSIPLVNIYKVYNPNPLELYNKLVILIEDSINYGNFQEILKIFNSSSFSDININLLEIGEPVIINIMPQDNRNDKNAISNYKLALILSFGILGLLLIFLSFYYKIYLKIYNNKNNITNNLNIAYNKNKIYSIKEEEIQKDINEESRVVEIANKITI